MHQDRQTISSVDHAVADQNWSKNVKSRIINAYNPECIHSVHQSIARTLPLQSGKPDVVTAPVANCYWRVPFYACEKLSRIKF